MSELEILEQQLKDLKASNLGAWSTYGSELCAGDMLKQEKELEDKIMQLKIDFDGDHDDQNYLAIEELERKFIFSKNKRESDQTLAQIIKLLPNDYDLGQYIRNLYSNKIS